MLANYCSEVVKSMSHLRRDQEKSTIPPAYIRELL